MTEETNRHGSAETNRRRFVQVAGAAGLVGIAGCSGGGSDDQSNGGDNGSPTNGGNETDGVNGESGTGGDTVNRAFTRGVWAVPKNLQYNSYNQTAPYSGAAAEYLHPPLNKPNLETGEVAPWVATDWGKNEGKYVIDLADMVASDGMPFHDGNGAFGAKDVATKFKLDTYLGYAPANFTTPERITALPEDRRVEVQLTKDYNNVILDERFANYRFNAPHHVYEKYLQMFQDGSTEQAKKELTSLTLDSPVGAGPHEFASADTKTLVLEKFEDHPAAEKTNFSTVNFIHTDGNQQAWQALRGGKTDGYNTIGTPREIVDSYPDHIMEITIPANWGYGLLFNAENPHYSKRNVRKAVAYALNRKEISKNAGRKTRAPVNLLSGIPGAMQGAPERVLGEKYIEKLESYGLTANSEQAAAQMREAGYSKEKGNWVSQSGEVPKFPLKVPAGFTVWVTVTQTLVSQLNQFGFDAEMVTVEGSSFFTQRTNGEFDVIAGGWSAGNTVPYLNYDFQLRGQEVQESANWDPEAAKVPPMGEPDASLQDAEINSTLDRLAKTNPDATDYQQYAAQGGWLENQLLWRMPIQEKLDQSWYTTDDWNVPPADSKNHQVNWPQGWHVRTGALSAETE